MQLASKDRNDTAKKKKKTDGQGCRSVSNNAANPPRSSTSLKYTLYPAFLRCFPLTVMAKGAGARGTTCRSRDGVARSVSMTLFFYQIRADPKMLGSVSPPPPPCSALSDPSLHVASVTTSAASPSIGPPRAKDVTEQGSRVRSPDDGLVPPRAMRERVLPSPWGMEPGTVRAGITSSAYRLPSHRGS